MDKFLARSVLTPAVLALAAAAGSAAPAAVRAAGPVLGSDAAACGPGAKMPAALVTVHGFKDAVGGLRIQLNSDDPDAFLAKGRELRRVVVPVTSTAPMAVCIALPATGRFAIAVLHDRNGDGKTSVLNDGYGFSNNPVLGYSKPALAKVLFNAGAGTASVDVVLNYMTGGAIRPLGGR